MDNNIIMRIFIVQVFCAWLPLTLSPVVKDDTVETTSHTSTAEVVQYVLVEVRINSLCHTHRSAVPTHTAILAQSEAENAEKKVISLKTKKGEV